MGIQICVEGFGLTQYKILWTKNGKDLPFKNLVDRLKQILKDENERTIPKEPHLFVPKSYELPKLGQVAMKIEELDEKTNNNEVQLIETSNEMFKWMNRTVLPALFCQFNQN